MPAPRHMLIRVGLRDQGTVLGVVLRFTGRDRVLEPPVRVVEVAGYLGGLPPEPAPRRDALLAGELDRLPAPDFPACNSLMPW